MFIHEKKKPLEFFYPKLATLDAVEAALREEFGARTPVIINKLKTGQALVDDEVEAHVIIADRVDNESEGVESLLMPGQEDNKDKAYVDIMRFGSGRRYVYWLQRGEGETTGYFNSLKIARLYTDIMVLT